MNMFIRNDIAQSDHIAIADDKGNKITYRELAEKAGNLNRYLEERSLLFLLCDHQMETAEFLYESLYIKAIPLLLAEDLDDELLNQLMEIYQPQYIFCQKSRKIKNMYHCCMEMERHGLFQTGNKRYKIHPDVALLLSTSGTTGSSKLVKLTYENLWDNAKHGCIHLNIHCGQKGLSPLPLYYAFGFSFCFWHWYCGATILITEEPVLSREFQEFYMREKANNFAATPYTYRMMQKIQFWDREKAGFLNFAISSGAQMAENEQISLVAALGEKFWLGYGQTECIGIVLAANFKSDHIKTGTVGKAFENVEVIIDPATNEMLIKSKSVCMGYASRKEDLSDGDINHGILHTGDTIQMEDGYIYLKGRLKRYVKILGKRVSLDDVGNYLENKYQNAEFACTGTDDHISIYHTSLKDHMDIEIMDLLDSSMKIPAKYISCVYLTKIPRSRSGKIEYAKLREMG